MLRAPPSMAIPYPACTSFGMRCTLSEEVFPLIVQSSLTVIQIPAQPAEVIVFPVTAMFDEHHKPTPWS